MGFPKTSDGRTIVLVHMFPGGVQLNFPGVGDDIANNTRFAGPEFALQSTIVEEKTLEWQFSEWIYIAGGTVGKAGGVYGDHFSYDLIAPATAGVSNVGAGAYEKMVIGAGEHMYVPAGTPGALGPDWDLDLDEKLNANVGFSKVVPVPAPTNPATGEQTGFFDWDPATEIVTVNAEGKGGFYLLDFEKVLACYAPKMSLMVDGETSLVVPNIKPKRLLAHWKHKLTIHNTTAKTLSVAWSLLIARATITP